MVDVERARDSQDDGEGAAGQPDLGGTTAKPATNGKPGTSPDAATQPAPNPAPPEPDGKPDAVDEPDATSEPAAGPAPSVGASAKPDGKPDATGAPDGEPVSGAAPQAGGKAESDGKPDATDKPDGEAAAGDEGDEKRKKAKKQRPFWKELPILIGIALVLTFLIQTFIARVFLIPSESMEETLHGCAGCYGDRVLVDKITYAFGDPEPGDVVVFERPETWTRSEFSANRSDNTVVRWLQDLGAMFGLASPNEDDVVKRVIATGGQTVECCDDQGRVMVDGKPLDEPYVYWDIGGPNSEQGFPPFRVPEGTLWVMGDNRNNSNDSRKQGGGREAGVVPVDNVIGKARYIVLPPSRWRGVGDHNPQAVALATTMQVGIPAGVGFAAAWPVLWLGRRVRGKLASGRR